MRFFRALCIGLLLFHSLPLMLTGCSGKPVDETDPASLFQDAEDEIKSDHYQIAIDKLRTIKNKFPYSKYSIDAQLRIGDVLFLQESFSEAAATYEIFRDLHPKHDKVAYAVFRIGKSYFNDIPDPLSRDLTPAQKALDAYNDLLKRFPNAPEAAEAKKDAAHTRDVLAAKELYIGDFYFKRDFLEAAKPRYEKVVTTYPETESAKRARAQIAEIDKRLLEKGGK
ncbi:outer membrane protein assembly factor BamD [Bdellovibrionota bacterium FG-1]